MVEVSASILSMKNENAIQTLYNLETSGINYFHIDVMDGKFVEADTTSKMLEYCEYLNSISNLPLDVHLMVEDAKSYINSFLVFEPNIFTISSYYFSNDSRARKRWARITFTYNSKNKRFK